MNLQRGAEKKSCCAETDGFTLLEVLVAVMILGLSYVAVLQSFSLSMQKIQHIETKRIEIFDNLLGFEQEARFTGDFDNDEEEETDFPLFLEGHKYNVVIITDDDTDLMSLKLEKNN
jgi:prepilin-type N-terminal cleavage/methylation domain-containing protein